MIANLEQRLNELRFLEGIEKVEHVPYTTSDQFWVRFNGSFDLGKLGDIVKKHDYRLVEFAGIPSKLPRGLAELVWDGVTHVIVKKISGWSEFTSKLGFEPDGMAKLAIDLHGPYRIFIATEEAGIQLLYEYLGLKYVPPPPPAPKPTPAAKPAAPPAAKPAQPTTPRPAAPATPAAAVSSQTDQTKPMAQQPATTQTANQAANPQLPKKETDAQPAA